MIAQRLPERPVGHREIGEVETGLAGGEPQRVHPTDRGSSRSCCLGRRHAIAWPSVRHLHAGPRRAPARQSGYRQGTEARPVSQVPRLGPRCEQGEPARLRDPAEPEGAVRCGGGGVREHRRVEREAVTVTVEDPDGAREHCVRRRRGCCRRGPPSVRPVVASLRRSAARAGRARARDAARARGAARLVARDRSRRRRGTDGDRRGTDPPVSIRATIDPTAGLSTWGTGARRTTSLPSSRSAYPQLTRAVRGGTVRDEEARDPVGRDRVVAVEERQPSTSSPSCADVASLGSSDAFRRDVADAGVRDRPDHRGGVVRRRIVDDDDLEVHGILAQHRRDRAADHVATVVRGDHHGHRGLGAHRRAPRPAPVGRSRASRAPLPRP